jgi:hypothetical protein
MELKHMVVGTPGLKGVTEGGVSSPVDVSGTEPTSHYPLNLTLHLHHHQLKHLGIEDHHDMPTVGREFHAELHGHISHSHHEEGPEGVSNRSLTLQITHMGLEHEDEEEEERDHAKRMYGPKEG